MPPVAVLDEDRPADRVREVGGERLRAAAARRYLGEALGIFEQIFARDLASPRADARMRIADRAKTSVLVVHYS